MLRKGFSIAFEEPRVGETAQSSSTAAMLVKLRRKKFVGRLHRLADMTIETPEVVVARIKRALAYVKPENVILAPDRARSS